MDPVWRRQWDRGLEPTLGLLLTCNFLSGPFCSLEPRANVRVSLCPPFIMNYQFPTVYAEEPQRCPAWDTGRCWHSQGLRTGKSLSTAFTQRS